MSAKSGAIDTRGRDLVASPKYAAASRLQRQNVEAHAKRILVLRTAVTKAVEGKTLKQSETDVLHEALLIVEDRFQREHYLGVDQALEILRQIRRTAR